VYGHEGKPLYISGPHETGQERCRIVEQLRRRCGEGNFHYLVGVGNTAGAAEEFDRFDDEDNRDAQH
jgi:hypothetical protein